MNIGMIVRADHTGLGNQTWEAWRHIKPAVTVVVVPTRGHASTLPQHVDRYPNADLVIEWDADHTRFPRTVDQALAHCDVVYSAETFYDRMLPVRLADRGIKTVLHANPELFNGDESPTDIWLPTTWEIPLVEAKGRGTPVVMPMPVPTDRVERRPPEHPLRVVHPTSIAMGDRNGGAALMRVVPFVLNRYPKTVFDFVGPPTKWIPHARTVDDWWDRDPGAWMSVIPRRYGGLCLPALEAIAAGVPVLMPDTSPQNVDWPCVVTFPTTKANPHNMKGGRITLNAPQPPVIRDTIMSMLNRDVHGRAVEATVAFGDANGPDQIIPRWLDRMHQVVMS